MIRLGFNARLLQFPDVRGWNRYAVELLAELPVFGVDPILYTDQPIHANHRARLGPLADAVRISPKLPYLAWEQAWLPSVCRLDRVEVLHSPYHFGLPWFGSCPKILTLHDAIDWAFGLGQKGDYRSRFHQWVARRRADRIITVSEHARGDLTRFLQIDPAKITVIPLAADARFFEVPSIADRDRARSLVETSSPYLFYLGGWEPRKNLPFLLRAFAEANVDGLTLVLAGGKDDQKADLIDHARTLNIQDRVRAIGYAPDADLTALYAEALAFVYPSEYEGFGLQLCEAMAAGCPILASNATSLPEVLGEGGETFPLDSSAGLAGLIRRVASEPAFQADLSRRARERSSRFSWSRTAGATAQVYRDAIGSRQPGQLRSD